MRNLILIVLGAVLLALGWLGVTGLVLPAALVPILWVVGRQERFWHAVGWAALGLGVWSAVTTWWIAMVPGGWPGAVLSPIITVVLFGAVFGLFWVVRRRFEGLSYVVFAAGWIVAERFWMNSELSFPWLVLGNGLANDTWAVQWYELTGVFGGSLWVLACNVLIYRILRRFEATAENCRCAELRPEAAQRKLRLPCLLAAPWPMRKKIIIAASVVFLPLIVSAVWYAAYEEQGEERVVTVVQPNFFPFQKFEYVDEQAQIDTMLRLSSTAPADVDLIVYPETAADVQIQEDHVARNPVVEQFRGLLAERYPDAGMILGATTLRFYRPGERISRTARETLHGGFYDYYNAALGIDTTSVVGIHHKSKLVVGVERIPFQGRWKFIDRLLLDLGGTSGSLGVDSVVTVFGGGVGAAICWEAVYGEYFAGFVRAGAGIMAVASNDSWWGDTRGHKQLFAYSRLRAIETRRAVARSANTGTSGFINRRGDVLARSGWDQTAALTATLRTNDRITFYTRWGDYVARIAMLVFVLGLLYYVALRFRSKG